MARPEKYNDGMVVHLDTSNVKSRLQENSERRAIIDRVVKMGGKASLAELNEYYGYDIRQTVMDLVRAGWLQLNDPG